MAAMTDFLENKLVDHLFRGTSFTAPTALYVGLLTAAPSDTGGGTEVTGGSYARVSWAPNGTNWTNTQNSGTGVSSGTGGTTSNSGAITFPAPTANWGTISHFAIYDASTVGNMLWWGALTQSKTVNNGDAAPSFQAGALSIQLDN
jgi:hypothetical protein